MLIKSSLDIFFIYLSLSSLHSGYTSLWNLLYSVSSFKFASARSRILFLVSSNIHIFLHAFFVEVTCLLTRRLILTFVLIEFGVQWKIFQLPKVFIQLYICLFILVPFILFQVNFGRLFKVCFGIFDKGFKRVLISIHR